jgi:hypothetical protein
VDYIKVCYKRLGMRISIEFIWLKMESGEHGSEVSGPLKSGESFHLLKFRTLQNGIHVLTLHQGTVMSLCVQKGSKSKIWKSRINARSLRRADSSSREVLPTVVCHCV